MDRSSKSKKANRLVGEKSPYLLQHAYNPVDWFPWGSEAFEKARREDRPIFLSIGYSTCHWCHVMEHESFEDPEVADLMNQSFVSIKVDREERPDIDDIYMKVCQMMTGSGGWPLTIIMTHDKRPFFAGTYIPKKSKHGVRGMIDLIKQIKTLWENDRSRVGQISERVMSMLMSEVLSIQSNLDASILDETFIQLRNAFDESHGGFFRAPKFPTPHILMYLLRYWKRTGEEKALDMVKTTLKAIRMGGIFDHLGFGVHRYSTDSRWLVPHFEKMLYDQALLTLACLETYQATGLEEYLKTAEEILDYVLRDMASPQGGFYSAEDADSEGIEGKFYLWTEEEIRKVLTIEEADFIVKVFNIETEGNFTEAHTGKKNENNILHLKRATIDVASENDLTNEQFFDKLCNIRKKLFSIREKRVHQFKDDKILLSWNGLMIACLAKASKIFQKPKYIETATKTVDFILKEMRDSEGKLIHRYREGEASILGFLNDYAFFVWGLIELYEATFNIRFLKLAVELNRIQIKHFWDKDEGGFYFTADYSEEILVRSKRIYDGAIPSGNSVAMLNLLRIVRFTGDFQLEEKAVDIARAFYDKVSVSPTGYSFLMTALSFFYGPSYEVVIVGDPEAEDTKIMLKAIWKEFIPNKVVLLRSNLESDEVAEVAPFTKHYVSLKEAPTAYVCQEYKCKLPTTDVHEMLKLLGSEN